MKKLSFCLLLICVLMCISCSEVSDIGGGYYGGEEIDREKLSEIAESVLEESLKDENGNIRNPDQTVYWTSGGSAVHSSKNCSYLKNSSSVQTGTLGDAIRLGKTKYCSSCFKNHE